MRRNRIPVTECGAGIANIYPVSSPYREFYFAGDWNAGGRYHSGRYKYEM